MTEYLDEAEDDLEIKASKLYIEWFSVNYTLWEIPGFDQEEIKNSG